MDSHIFVCMNAEATAAISPENSAVKSILRKVTNIQKRNDGKR